MPEDDQDLPRRGLYGEFQMAFARFEGAMSAEIKNLAHDVKNLTQSLAAYATNRDLKAAEDRIEKLEKNQTWIARTVVGSVVMALLGLLGLVAKGGHL